MSAPTRTPSADAATIKALRADVALQIARHIQSLGVNQLVAASRLRVPQPTLSKIVNRRLSGLSLELLIRIAVRAGVPLSLQTGVVPQEAGAFVATRATAGARTFPSRVAADSCHCAQQAEYALTPAQRLEAFVAHNELQAMLRQAGRTAEAALRLKAAPPT